MFSACAFIQIDRLKSEFKKQTQHICIYVSITSVVILDVLLTKKSYLVNNRLILDNCLYFLGVDLTIAISLHYEEIDDMGHRGSDGFPVPRVDLFTSKIL